MSIYRVLKWIGMLAWAMGCRNDTLSGGSEIGNPDSAVLSGVIYTRKGTPARNISLQLLPDDYNSFADSMPDGWNANTDEKGSFIIKGIEPGLYALSAGKINDTNRLFLPGLEISLSDDTWIRATLEPSGKIVVTLSDSILTDAPILFIPGTDRWFELNISPIIIDNILSSEVKSLRLWDVNRKEPVPFPPGGGIQFITPDGLLFYPEYFPNTPTGPEQGRVDSSYQFSANTVPFPPWKDCPSNEDLLRFSWGDGTTSEWSPQKTIFHTWNREGKFPVRVQVGCETELHSQPVKLVSNWSLAHEVNILK